MAKEYIEREATIELLRSIGSRDYRREKGTIQEAIKMVSFSEYTPAADVVEVRHGRWIQPHWKNSNYCCNCSECGREAMHADYQWDKNGIYPLCPHCGAIMDVEEV